VEASPLPPHPQAREYVSRYVETEILNHCRLRHPHIIGFREVYLSKDSVNM
jgi:hypothetical protein